MPNVICCPTLWGSGFSPTESRHSVIFKGRPQTGYPRSLNPEDKCCVRISRCLGPAVVWPIERVEVVQRGGQEVHRRVLPQDQADKSATGPGLDRSQRTDRPENSAVACDVSSSPMNFVPAFVGPDFTAIRIGVAEDTSRTHQLISIPHNHYIHSGEITGASRTGITTSIESPNPT